MANDSIEESDAILNIKEPFTYDESIKSSQYSEIILQSQDNINIPSQTITFNINNQSTIFLPSKSYLRFEGRIVKADDTAYAAGDEVTLVNNAIMYLFSSIRYKIGSTEIETVNCPGQTTSMMGYLTLPDDFSTSSGLKSCWTKDTTDNANSVEYAAITANQAAGAHTPTRNVRYNQGFAVRKGFIFSSNPIGTFEFVIPLSHIFGFAGYKKIIYGAKHSLILTRDSDNQAIFRADGVDAGKVKLSNIAWHIPEIELNPLYEASIMKMINDKEIFPISFIARTCEYTAVPRSVRMFDWRLSVTGGIEKPRWLIFGFQINRSTQTTNPAVFDNLDLTNAFVRLNTIRYPKDDLSINFATNKYAQLYENFDNFKKEYYGFDEFIGGNQVNYASFKTLFPILVFDLRRQNEKFRSTVVDMSVKFFFNANVPDNTTVYSVILSDRLYNLSSDGTMTTMVSY